MDERAGGLFKLQLYHGTRAVSGLQAWNHKPV